MKVLCYQIKPNGVVRTGTHAAKDDVTDRWVKRLNTQYPDIRHWARRVNSDGTLMKRFYVTWCIRESSIVEAPDEQDAYDIVQRGDAPDGGSAYMCDTFTADEIERGE